MHKKTNKYHRHRRNVNTQKGEGVINWLIDNLPIELHPPNYRYLGPGIQRTR